MYLCCVQYFSFRLTIWVLIKTECISSSVNVQYKVVKCTFQFTFHEHMDYLSELRLQKNIEEIVGIAPVNEKSDPKIAIVPF